MDALRDGRQPLREPDRHEPGQGGRRDRVDHEQPAGAQQPARLRDGSRQVGDVFEDLARHDDVRATVPQRDLGDAAAHRRHAVGPSLRQRAGRDVHPDVPVALARHVRCEQAGPAAEVDEHGVPRRRFSCRRGHQRTPGSGQPVQHHERAARVPPLRGQVVVLGRVVPLPAVTDPATTHHPAVPRRLPRAGL